MYLLGHERLLRMGESWQEMKANFKLTSISHQGDAEVIVGKWLALNPDKRKDIFLATKFGAIPTPEGFTFRGDAEYVPIACEKSLKRLGVQKIDLYYPHRLDGSTPIEHIVAEMVKLKE